MTTLTIELKSSKTLSLIEQLESLDLLRIVKEQTKPCNIADMLAGSITHEQAAQMNRELTEMRV
ncbi:MAG: hypothetical protein LBR84_10890 [Tannerella sp.]|jgi:hypothetical protein|nr:hypothetical protein [Tannerella sp.]